MNSQEVDAPLVSVAIATHNRSALLPEAIRSVLAQSMRDLELLIVDDGSTDSTGQVVREFAAADSRVRYLYKPNGGIASARNLAADEARGLYTAVHDDDDIMLPWRLEKQLDSIEIGSSGAYGSFANFDDETGALVFHHGRGFSQGAVLMTGFAPGHSTWLVRSDILRVIRYDETLSSAVDNNIALRMLRSGVRLHHSGVVCVLRRVHGKSITAADGSNQAYAATRSRALVAHTISAEQQQRLIDRAKFDWGTVSGRHNFAQFVQPYLPDHLSKRDVAILIKNEDTSDADTSSNSGDAEAEGLGVVSGPRRNSTFQIHRSVSLENLLEWHRQGLDTVVLPSNTPESVWVDALIQRYLDSELGIRKVSNPDLLAVSLSRSASGHRSSGLGAVSATYGAARKTVFVEEMTGEDVLNRELGASDVETQFRLAAGRLDSAVRDFRTQAAGPSGSKNSQRVGEA